MIKLSIVIPCYNEANNIPILVDKLNKSFLPDSEIILVDNGSTDDTPVVLSKTLELVNNALIRSVRLENNIGYGRGIMVGISEAKGEIIAWTHADLQTDIKDVYIGFKMFKEQSDQEGTFLKGIRKERPFIDYILTRGMSIIASIYLGEKLYDINAQPKMFHRSILEFIIDAPDDFSIDLYFYFIARKNGIDVLELPVFFKKRLYDEAKGGGGSTIWKRIKIIWRTFTYILKLKNRRIQADDF